MSRQKITRDSAGYPELLKEIDEPPSELWIEGELPSQAPSVAIVGARKATPYGLEVAEWFASELALSGCLIVSGMARGIDSAAHRGALQAGARTVAVLGNGVDICYPPSNGRLFRLIRESGALVSEYPPGTAARKHQFPERNRIIAGLCLGVVVVEGTRKGGGMITARLAGEYGREVFSIPGPLHSPYSEGPHGLIRDGAVLVASPNDVLEGLGMLRVESSSQELDLAPDDARVWSALGADPRLVDVISSAASLPPSTTSSVLARLEVRGLVTRHEGGRFAKAVSETTKL